MQGHHIFYLFLLCKNLDSLQMGYFFREDICNAVHRLPACYSIQRGSDLIVLSLTFKISTL